MQQAMSGVKEMVALAIPMRTWPEEYRVACFRKLYIVHCNSKKKKKNKTPTCNKAVSLISGKSPRHCWIRRSAYRQCTFVACSNLPRCTSTRMSSPRHNTWWGSGGGEEGEGELEGVREEGEGGEEGEGREGDLAAEVEREGEGVQGKRSGSPPSCQWSSGRRWSRRSTAWNQPPRGGRHSCK